MQDFFNRFFGGQGGQGDEDGDEDGAGGDATVPSVPASS